MWYSEDRFKEYIFYYLKIKLLPWVAVFVVKFHARVRKRAVFAPSDQREFGFFFFKEMGLRTCKSYGDSYHIGIKLELSG